MNLRIRKLNKGDLEPLYRLLSDERVMRYLEPPYTRERTEKFLEEVNRFDPPLVYAVEEEGSFIGYVIFHDYDETTMEIGWVLYPEYWGKGYASYLMELMMERCRELKKAPMIECDPGQEVSKHIALKYGFYYIGEIDGLDVYRRIEMLKLIEPATEYAEQIREYRRDLLDNGSSMDGTGPLRYMEDPYEWIDHSEKGKYPETTPEGLVPATQYMLLREDDQKIVGMLQIRHCFNDHLEKYGGHIGYSVAPGERRKGYASKMLSMALPKCRDLGLDRVLITCNEDNEGSRKTILKNGGKYESTVFEPEEGENLERYWIDIPNE